MLEPGIESMHRSPDWLASFCQGTDHKYLSFGQRLRLIRRSLDLSLTEVSGMLARGGYDTSPTELNNIEEDAAGLVDFVLVYALAYVMRVEPASWLWTGLECEYDASSQTTRLHPRIPSERTMDTRQTA
jgi:transcriptional regulator with XRE-family HTH domain